MNKQEIPPCINCITYAICKNINNDSPSVASIAVFKLVHKCSLMHEYLIERNKSKIKHSVVCRITNGPFESLNPNRVLKISKQFGWMI